jgi:hypothetical protein
MTLIIFDTSAEVLPKSVLIGYAQSGKCNERQASTYADSSAFIRSDNHMINPIEIDHNTHNARVASSSPAIATNFLEKYQIDIKFHYRNK